MTGIQYLSLDKEKQASSFTDVHTTDNPYCLDMTCRCHTDWQWHATFIREQELGEPSKETYQAALNFFGVKA